MKFLGYNKVLCLSPHPDDVEYSMLGTIIKYTDTEFVIICFSEGGLFDDSASINRLQECKNCWNLSGCENYKFISNDTKFVKQRDDDDWIHYIETKINILEFDCIIIPAENDSHFEHILINKIGIPLNRTQKIDIIEYKTPSTMHSWIPNLFINIDEEYLNKKIECLLEFKSQLHHVYFEKDIIKNFHINFQCSKRGIKYVEHFRIIQKYD